jgi:hypothetical protein
MKKQAALVLSLFASLPLFAALEHGAPLKGIDSPYVVDVNRDGRDDLISGNRLFVNNGSGVFTDAGPLPGLSTGIRIISAADFNGDGVVDFLVGTLSTQTAPISLGGVVIAGGEFVVLGGGGGYSLTYAVPTGSHAVVSSIDDDGRSDLILARTNLDGWREISKTLTLMRSKGDGTFQQTGEITLAPAKGDVRSYAWTDLDRDGHVDLILRMYTSLAVYRGHGDGTFEPVFERFLPAPLGMLELSVGDIDGDGLLDLAGSGGQAGVIVLFGDGHGRFPRVARAALDLGPTALVHQDSNARFDLAGAESNGDIVVLTYRNNSLQVASRTPTGMVRPTVKGGAFHSIGRNDLIAVSGYSDPQIFYPAPPPVPSALAVGGGGRVRAARPPSSEETLAARVEFRSLCTSPAAESWLLTREGLFNADLRRADRKIEVVQIDDLMYVQVLSGDGARILSGMLVRSELGHFTGSLVSAESTCGGSILFTDLYTN